MEKVKKLLNNQWVVNICAPIIVAGITTFGVSLTQKVSLKDSIVIIVNFIKSILNFKVSIWVIGLSVIIAFTIIYIMLIMFAKSDSRKYPDWYYDFKTIKYKEWTWAWIYEMYSNKYEIKNLRPICSCGCGLVERSRLDNMHFNPPRLVCPNCKTIYNSPEYATEKEVKHLIEYKVRTNTYIKEPVTD